MQRSHERLLTAEPGSFPAQNPPAGVERAAGAGADLSDMLDQRYSDGAYLAIV
ncbi:hypothetical protein QVE09_01810 [Paenibacillus sp. ClWae2A]|uniref:hypothetical protein n=1 Tax=Paenibacillus sp. ClWae2A TaxID=3057177 RepID=UPI0028F5880A|nr:hypothetical protein [Paenibacillus sp. ClWae2A]MDT9717614.1 hypothetical protein [Paenibacillus sp. ClWae2A]